jgi:hypothetical protein
MSDGHGAVGDARKAIWEAQAACLPPNDYGKRRGGAGDLVGPQIGAGVVAQADSPHALAYPDIYGGCPCFACWDNRNPAPEGGIRWGSVMNLCPACGNKRCPAAGDHAKWACSGSNETGQRGTPIESPAPVDAVTLTEQDHALGVLVDETCVMFTQADVEHIVQRHVAPLAAQVAAEASEYEGMVRQRNEQQARAEMLELERQGQARRVDAAEARHDALAARITALADEWQGIRELRHSPVYAARLRALLAEGGDA